MRIKLTPSFVSGAEAQPNDERTIYWDADLPGFGLCVTRNGAKSFVCQYRAGKRSRRLAIRATLRLSEARREAKAVLGRVAKGGDPLTERRKVEGAAVNTLQSICEIYFKREGKKLRTIAERQKTLRRLVYPVLGSKQVDDVRRSDITRLLDRIEDCNGAVMADHTLAYLRRVLNWHATRSDEFRTPITRGMARTKPAERTRDRILTDDEIRAIWAATGEMRNAFGPLVRFTLLTATRRDEAAEMPRSELVGDIWTIPAERAKGKHDVVVPLSKVAQAILNALPVIGDGKLVFTHDGRRPVGGFSKFKARLDQQSGTAGWRLHDLRRTARSLMSRAGVSADIAERCLGHVIGGVRGVYDRHEYLAEKRQAFEALAAQVDTIIAKSGAVK
ncbi:MAG: integrase arm-type DNA-binding domain-containing protein [Xanthobacteraceae bacterium]